MKQLMYFLFAIALWGCKAKPAMKTFDKIIGEWEQTQRHETFKEKWTKSGDTFYGNGIMLYKQDTIFQESMTLVDREKTVYYETTSPNENGGKTIAFTLTQCSKTKWVFENPAHDFPKKIIYKFNSDDHLEVQVEGDQKEKNLFFEFQRVL